MKEKRTAVTERALVWEKIDSSTSTNQTLAFKSQPCHGNGSNILSLTSGRK